MSEDRVEKVLTVLRDEFTMKDWNKFLSVFGIANMTIEDVYNAMEGTPITKDNVKYSVMLMRTPVAPNQSIQLIQCIKVVRSNLHLGLKEAKDLVDSSAAGPVTLAAGLYDDEANDLMGKLIADAQSINGGVFGFKFFIQPEGI